MTSGEAPVEIVPYDPSWPARFKQEAKLLRRTLVAGLVGPIEHIGSTAIPGLVAKPVIDIMAGVASLDASRPAIAVLIDMGYCYSCASSEAASSDSFARPKSSRTGFEPEIQRLALH
jgi:GrpB-like predicted nucleotidyltransferase (UPF0157 family)